MVTQLRPEYRVTILMLAGCLLFASLIAAEWAVHAKYVADLNARLSEIGDDAGLLPESFPDEAISLASAETFSEMVERPLFVAGRRPMEEQAETADAGTEPVFTGKLNIKLMGVISVPEGKTVLFVDSAGKYSRAEQDDTIEGWRVSEVQFDRVVLEQSGAVEELLLRKPKPKVGRTPRRNVARPASRGDGDVNNRRKRQRNRVDQDE